VVGEDQAGSGGEAGSVITPRRSLDSVREVLRAVRRAPERLLHPWRRRRALARLASAPPPVTVLVVCHGNICRSPYAAAKLRALLPAGMGVRVESAGFIGPHRPSPADAIAVAQARGIDLRRHRSRLLTQVAVGGADLVIVMEPRQVPALHARYGSTKRPVLVLGDLDPASPHTRAVRDPVEQSRKVFAECYERIDTCLAGLVQGIWGPARS